MFFLNIGVVFVSYMLNKIYGLPLRENVGHIVHYTIHNLKDYLMVLITIDRLFNTVLDLDLLDHKVCNVSNLSKDQLISFDRRLNSGICIANFWI
jgi:hypothetical protein